MAECPSQAVLQTLVTQGPAPDQKALVDHIDECETCLQTLARLTEMDVATPWPETAQVPEFLLRLSESQPVSATTEEKWEELLDPPRTDESIGCFGPFEVLSKLGQGGMGIVLLAKDPSLDRLVALKIIRPSLMNRRGYRERFLREAQAMATIEHPHVVPVYHVDQYNGVPVMVMKYMQGETLSRRLRRTGPLPAGELRRLGNEVAAGLGAAHALDRVHRDIKPSNLFLESPNGAARILDFGLARPVERDELTADGALVGTPGFMSPEQARGDQVDHRSDLFSLGTVLYYAGSGRLPFDGEHPMAILSKLANDRPHPLVQLNQGIDAGFGRSVMWLLEKDPIKRPQTAAEWAQSVDRPARSRYRKRVGVVGFFVLFFSFIAAVVIATIRTPHGEITIELAEGVDRETVAIQLSNDGKVKIADTTNGFSVTVAEGSYDAKLLDESLNLELTPKRVVVRKGDVEKLRVTIRARGDSLEEAETLTDREIVAWVLSVGGRVKDNFGKSIDSAVIPEAVERIRDIDLSGCAIRDRDLARLGHLSRLYRLTIGDDRDEVLTRIDHSKRPRHALSEDSFRILLEANIPALRELFVYRVPVSPSAMRDLSKIDSIQHLTFGGTRFSEQSFGELANMQSLSRLTFNQCAVSPTAPWSRLASLPIRLLSIADPQLSNDLIAGLPEWPSLESLYLNGINQTVLSSKAIESINRRSELQRFHLIQMSNAKTDRVLLELELTKLEVLQLATTKCATDEVVLRLIENNPGLRVLDVRNTSITEALLDHLADYPELKTIRLGDNDLREEAIADLRKSLPGSNITSSP